MSEGMTLLQSGLSALGLELSSEQQAALLTYLDLLLKWNKKFNLTAITDHSEMIRLHLLDSLAIGPHLLGKRFIDVGTGAGLPGIPLAIAYPETHWTLLDSNGKKTRFLIQAKATLQLKNVDVVNARVEAFEVPPFDAVISRAFTQLENMLEKTAHLCCNGGHFLAMKGSGVREEINALGKQIPPSDLIRLSIPGLNAQRHLVIIEKDV